MKPSPVSLDNGEYKVQYTAFTDGAYSITIKVGRGGSDYMEVIEGVGQLHTYCNVFAVHHSLCHVRARHASGCPNHHVNRSAAIE